MGIKYWFKSLEVITTYLFRPTYTANICGHKTKLYGFMNDGHGHTSIMQMSPAKNKRPDYCLACIGKMTIQCAWCGAPITIGSPITLYTPKKGHKMPKHAVPYTENGSSAYVGCLGWECADTGADMCGHWIPPGEVRRMPSPLEACLASVHAGTPSLVIMDDTSDPNSMSVHPLP